MIQWLRAFTALAEGVGLGLVPSAHLQELVLSFQPCWPKELNSAGHVNSWHLFSLSSLQLRFISFSSRQQDLLRGKRKKWRKV